MRDSDGNRQTIRELSDHVMTLENRVRLLDLKLRVVRRMYADLVAAARAALAAHVDGEDDPWGYLRDELPAPPEGHPLSRIDGRGWCR